MKKCLLLLSCFLLIGAVSTMGQVAKKATAKKQPVKTTKTKAKAKTVSTATNYKLNVEESFVSWIGYKVTGSHNGKVMFKEASIMMDGSNIKSGQFVMDMNTISCEDIKGEYAAKFVNHLKAEDFFDTAKHPYANFKMTSAVNNGGGLYTIKGNMTIKETTQPVELQATVNEENGVLMAKGKLKLDRTKFGIKYGSTSFFDKLGDKAINNDFDLDIEMKLSK